MLFNKYDKTLVFISDDDPDWFELEGGKLEELNKETFIDEILKLTRTKLEESLTLQ